MNCSIERLHPRLRDGWDGVLEPQLHVAALQVLVRLHAEDALREKYAHGRVASSAVITVLPPAIVLIESNRTDTISPSFMLRMCCILSTYCTEVQCSTCLL